ncbi:hypothetical protein D6D01_06595 [Aureobasidium pullulans]|uniref:Uncharacterized protein n=1 Tax=Aureobasidium pullulans TaxID=5580 RepID=A0A4S9KY92_AURPU|nr:hypothetical protein D6D01_06595 [Aureobasidium pullulans]
MNSSMTSLSERMAKMPSEIRRMIWRLVIQAEEDSHDDLDDTLGHYVALHMYSPTMAYLYTKHLAVAEEYMMARLRRRHMIIGSVEHGDEYLEELLLTQKMLIPVRVFWRHEKYRDRAKTCLERWIDLFQRRGQLCHLGQIGLFLDEVETWPKHRTLLPAVVESLFQISKRLSPGRVVVEAEYTSSVEFELFSYPIGPEQETRKIVHAAIDKADRVFKKKIVQDPEYGIMVPLYPEEEGPSGMSQEC